MTTVSKFEKRDRELHHLLDNRHYNYCGPTEERLKDIECFWQMAKNDEIFLREAVAISQNKFGEYIINGVATICLIIERHKEISPEILSTLLNNLFKRSSNIDKRLFTRNISILDGEYTYLTFILMQQDLVLNEEYQDIITDHIVNENELYISNSDIAFFLMRENTDEKYKKEVLKTLSKETLNEIYQDIYTSKVNDLIHNYKMPQEEFYNMIDYVEKTPQLNEKLSQTIKLNLSLLKRLRSLLDSYTLKLA